MKVAVIGLGRFGLALAKKLRLMDSVHLVAVDNQEDHVAALNHDGEWVLYFDDWDVSDLDELGIDKSLDAAVVAIGEDAEEAQRWVLALLKAKVRCILARAQSGTQARIMERLLSASDASLGDHRVLRPEAEAAHRLAQSLGTPGLQEILEIRGGEAIATLRVPQALVGRTLLEAKLRNTYRLNVLQIQRMGSDGEEILLRIEPEVEFAEGDVLTVLGTPDDVRDFAAGS